MQQGVITAILIGGLLGIIICLTVIGCETIRGTIANRKAKKLFYSHLTKEQKLTAKYGFICVQGNLSKELYHIHLRQASGNIRRKTAISNGVAGHRWWFCIVSRNPDIPKYDTLLAQKMLIECDEQQFLATAVGR